MNVVKWHHFDDTAVEVLGSLVENWSSPTLSSAKAEFWRGKRQKLGLGAPYSEEVTKFFVTSSQLCRNQRKPSPFGKGTFGKQTCIILEQNRHEENKSPQSTLCIRCHVLHLPWCQKKTNPASSDLHANSLVRMFHIRWNLMKLRCCSFLSDKFVYSLFRLGNVKRKRCLNINLFTAACL